MNSLSRKDFIRLKGLAQGRPVIGPRSINIHLTNVCDRRCRFCWYFSPLVSYKDKYKELDYGVLEKLLKDCADMGVDEINLEGGEIALYSRITDVFRLVNRLGMRLIGYTHLAYGREHLAHIWCAHRLTINLSAASPDVYRQVHGGDHFGDVLANLRLLQKIRDVKGKPELTLIFIIFKENYKELGGFLDIAESIPVDKVVLKFFIPTVEMKDLVLSAGAMRELTRIVNKARRKPYRVNNNLSEISQLLKNGSWFKNRESLSWTERHNDRLFHYNKLSVNKPPCYIGWYYAYIDERGRVIAPCDNAGAFVAGNIYKESFKHIWFHSKQLNRARMEALKGIDVNKKRWFACRCCGHGVFNRSMQDLLRQRSSGTTECL